MRQCVAASRVPVLAVLLTLLAGCDRVFGLDEVKLEETNFYTCNCDCSRRVIAPLGGSVYTSPGGVFISDVLLHATGAIVDGPVAAPFNGQTVPWWQVSFDSGPSGWIVESSLKNAPETRVTKASNVCLPAPYNPYLGGGGAPSFDDLQALCSGVVADEAQAAIDAQLAPLGKFFCECGARSAVVSDQFDASCTQACPDGKEVCLVAGFDPPDPTPALFENEVLQPVSVCTVSGDVQISAGGRTPKRQPQARGELQVRGRPCAPGAACALGMSYQLTSDDIEFDSGSIFASDPKFVDIGLSGATEPDAINMGSLLGFYLGEVRANTAFSSLRARRSTQLKGFYVAGRNTEGLALAMNWPSRVCRVSGQLVGQAVGDGDEGTLDAQVDVALDGLIVNQPPVPNAGLDRTVECTSPSGASVTLDASGSTDADGNLSFYEWRRGAQQLAAPSASPLLTVQQALGEQTYNLLVADRGLSADRDAVVVRVADTTAPQIACNAPATVTPSDVPGKGFPGPSWTATATDACTGVASLTASGVTCTGPGQCKAVPSGATLTLYQTGGVGNVIRWTVQARDAGGNTRQQTCEVRVVKK
ncbi:hypothetical protein FGE12_04685 [Aggregicoccus sp. 17bor-14]|uniref:PKD domain-containing protein n=1 Tax=Myxococcaceae TaxID=31 RepID=UPI00129C2647|nr:MULTISPECIES: PKD domain-containing protein [Myxococcaceae]MBF5041676.1 hypothetical protein [Simulacricoccus sp. 17bor-14]MRI87458.1 hypothetical protein [Aggregicoccus sp. 17bor-14]